MLYSKFPPNLAVRNTRVLVWEVKRLILRANTMWQMEVGIKTFYSEGKQ